MNDVIVKAHLALCIDLFIYLMTYIPPISTAQALGSLQTLKKSKQYKIYKQ